MRLQIYTDESDGGERLIRAMKQEGVTVVREETEDADAVVLFLNGQESGFRRLETLRIKWQCPVVVVGHEERVYCYEEIRSLELGADDYVPAGTASNVLLLRLQRLFRLSGDRTDRFITGMVFWNAGTKETMNGRESRFVLPAKNTSCFIFCSLMPGRL